MWRKSVTQINCSTLCKLKQAGAQQRNDESTEAHWRGLLIIPTVVLTLYLKPFT